MKQWKMIQVYENKCLVFLNNRTHALDDTTQALVYFI